MRDFLFASFWRFFLVCRMDNKYRKKKRVNYQKKVIFYSLVLITPFTCPHRPLPAVV